MTTEQNKEYELMKRFIEENTDITLKFMMWQEEFLEPQIFTQDVDAESDRDWETNVLSCVLQQIL